MNTGSRTAIDTGADEFEAERLGGQDRDSVHPRPNVFRDAQREVVVAIRGYANRWVPREARPRLQITDARGRRPARNDAERKNSGRDQGDCDSSGDGRMIDPNNPDGITASEALPFLSKQHKNVAVRFSACGVDAPATCLPEEPSRAPLAPGVNPVRPRMAVGPPHRIDACAARRGREDS